MPSSVAKPELTADELASIRDAAIQWENMMREASRLRDSLRSIRQRGMHAALDRSINSLWTTYNAIRAAGNP